jgi:hypothetical protein
MFFLGMLKPDYIYCSKLISIGKNSQAKQSVVFRVVKPRYVLWPGIKFSMYSFQSKSDSITIIPGRVKATLCI